MALHTMSQEDVVHLLRELHHSGIAAAIDTLIVGIKRITIGWPREERERRALLSAHCRRQTSSDHAVNDDI